MRVNADAIKDETTLQAAAEAIFGDGFRVLVGVEGPADGADAWSEAVATPPAGATRGQIGRWLADYSSVRVPLGRYARLTTLLNALGRAPSLGVRQLARQSSRQGSVRPESWVGMDPYTEPQPTVSVLSVVVDQTGETAPAGITYGLIVDHFFDRLPDPPERTSGVAFNALAASARPPQTGLIAVPPDGADWSGDKHEAVLADTLDLAKLRAVRLEHTAFAGQLLPAIYVQSHSLQDETVLDWRDLTYTMVSSTVLNSSMRFVKGQS